MCRERLSKIEMYVNPVFMENPFQYYTYSNRYKAYEAIDKNILEDYREFFYVKDYQDSEEDKEYKSYTR